MSVDKTASKVIKQTILKSKIKAGFLDVKRSYVKVLNPNGEQVTREKLVEVLEW